MHILQYRKLADPKLAFGGQNKRNLISGIPD